MKKIRLIAAFIICSLVVLVGSAFAAYMSDASVWSAAKEKYADFNLKSIKWTSNWKAKKTYSRNGSDIEVKIEATKACIVTSADGKKYTGLMIISGGEGNWEFDRFFVSETEATKVKKMSGAELKTAVVDAYKNANPNIMCSLLDTIPSQLLYIAEIKPIDSTLKTPSEGYMTLNVDITFGARNGYTGIKSQTRTVAAEFRKTDGVWKFVVSRNVAFKDKKNIDIPRAQADSLKTLQSAGWDAIYGQTEPQQ